MGWPSNHSGTIKTKSIKYVATTTTTSTKNPCVPSARALSPFCLFGFFTAVSAQVPSPAPTFSEPCHVCGDPDLIVDPHRTVMLSNETFLCTDVEEIAQANQFSPDQCTLLQGVVPHQCNCGPPVSQTENPSEAQNDFPTQAPSYTEPCFVCGDPELMIDPWRAVEIFDEVYTCAEVEEAFQGTQIFSPLECDFVVSRVKESCNCRSPLSEPSAPSPTPAMPVATTTPTPALPSLQPPTSSPTDSPVEDVAESSVLSSESSVLSSGTLIFLYVLAVAVFLSTVLLCWKRSIVARSSRKGGPAGIPDLEAGIDTSPAVQNGGGSYATTAASTTVSTAASRGRSEKNNEEDDSRLHSTRASTNSAAVASRQSRDPSPSSLRRGSRSSARSASGEGSYNPNVKDQCRSVRFSQREPVLVEAIPIDEN